MPGIPPLELPDGIWEPVFDPVFDDWPPDDPVPVLPLLELLVEDALGRAPRTDGSRTICDNATSTLEPSGRARVTCMVTFHSPGKLAA